MYEIFVLATNRKGLAKLVRDASFFNLTIDDAIDRIEDKIINKGYTEAYIRQTAIDSISQYKGAINDEVRIAYELTDMLYISNIIETSRPICSTIGRTVHSRGFELRTRACTERKMV